VPTRWIFPFHLLGLADAPLAAPAWVQGLYARIDTRLEAVQHAMQIDLARLRGEHAVLLANSQAGHGAPLYDPTLPNQWALLIAPNPTSRDDLMSFDRE
jgi:hypothetical protein